MPTNHFDESVAERYDQATAELSEPAVVEPMSTSSPRSPAMARHSSSASAPAASRSPWHIAASACTASTSRRRWLRDSARSRAARTSP